MPRLVVEKGRDKGKTLRLKENGIFLVGRDVRVNLRLADPQASRRHFKITCRLGEVRLEDLDSSNGTFVNGKSIRSTTLSSGDKVELGESVIFFLEDENEDASVRRGELTGKEIAGYRLGRLLGRGGMGTVYEAVQISLERTVAYKVLAKELAEDDQFIQRFMAEARAAGALNHPNIVQVYDVGSATIPDRPAVRYYSMEYMSRGSVDDLLRKEKKLSFAKALPILFDAARGLEYAERHGVVHRDIKPQNLFISDESIVKIGDLGIAQRRRLDDKSPKDDTVSGSPHYMAPEQARGEQIDGRADLYALGVSLYEMLAGELPYDGASAREVILKHLNEPAPPLASKSPDAPPAAVELAERLMAKDRAQRLPSARILLQELVGLAKSCELPSDTRIRIEAVMAGAQELASGPPAKQSDKKTIALDSTATSALPAPDLGSGPSPEASGPVEAQGRSLLTTAIALVLVAAIAGGAGFGIVRKIRQAAAARRQGAEDQLARLRRANDATAAPDDTDVAVAKRELLGPIEAAGYRDLALEAHKLVEEMEARRDQRARETAAKKAADALAPLQERLAKAREAAAGEPKPEVADELDGLAKELDALARAAPSTPAGRQAADLAPAVASEAVKAREAFETRRRREAEAESAIARRRESIERLTGSRRYKDARASAREFEKEWSDLPSTRERVQALLAVVDAAARADLDGRLTRARDFSANGAYDDARLVLKGLEPEVEGSMAREIATELASIAAKEKRHNESEARRAATSDEAPVKAALEDIAETVAARAFGDAAARLDASRKLVATAAARETLERRARRLRAAQDALDRIVDRVKRRGAQAGIDHTFVIPESGIGPRPAVDAEATGLVFQIAPGDRRRIAFREARTDELHGWVLRTLEREADVALVRLDAAALGLELGRRALARADVELAADALEKHPDAARVALLKELRGDAEGDDGDKPDPPRKDDD